MKTISLLSRKGGTGKSTTCVNLAGFLSKEFNKKILIIDLDSQGNSSKVFLNIIPEKTSFNIFKKEDINSLISKTNYENIDIIPADQNLSAIDLLINNEISRESILKKSLDNIKYHYDFVLFDCSPSLNLTTINAMTSSDYLIIPSLPELFSIQAYFQIEETIALVKENLNPELKNLGILITMYDKRLNLHNQIISKIIEENIKMFNVKIPRTVSISESFIHNKLIFDYKPDSKGSKSYKKLAKEFMEHL